jgi:hypothetical protein
MKELTRLSVQRRRFRISNPIGSGAPMMLTRAVAWLNTSAGAAYSWLARCTVAVVDEQETVGVALSSLPMRHITPSPRAAELLVMVESRSNRPISVRSTPGFRMT